MSSMMDSMIGGDFEKGLASLKAAAEKSKVARLIVGQESM